MENRSKKEDESKAFNRMAGLCAKREYCVFDIKTKLMRSDIETESVERIIEQLKKEKYIDELRFARSFINDKIRFNKWGKIKIDFALKQKRIPQSIISEAFQDFSNKQLNEDRKSVV